MNLVDSSGWLAFFAETKNAEKFFAPLQNVEHLLVPTVIIYEVSKVLLRERGEEAAILGQAHMQQCTVVDLSAKLAINAAALSLENRIPMADSIILATARAFDATIWTQDDHFKGFTNVKYFPA
jgi:predicted nucleic acid-binding protein